jgi:hypothetical protein
VGRSNVAREATELDDHRLTENFLRRRVLNSQRPALDYPDGNGNGDGAVAGAIGFAVTQRYVRIRPAVAIALPPE